MAVFRFKAKSNDMEANLHDAAEILGKDNFCEVEAYLCPENAGFFCISKGCPGCSPGLGSMGQVPSTPGLSGGTGPGRVMSGVLFSMPRSCTACKSLRWTLQWAFSPIHRFVADSKWQVKKNVIVEVGYRGSKEKEVAIISYRMDASYGALSNKLGQLSHGFKSGKETLSLFPLMKSGSWRIFMERDTLLLNFLYIGRRVFLCQYKGVE
ncbi:hypothetical protein HPB48_020393 [Haemaphysalis longicornis]|uniref:Uncharacterized protein n=1 Tax=Haemaphysalis longicornis TaxID=44386 RepID=A0A9J6G793_HAELO|nr:hypothetical protein HPB48_020393 [Haemaphysalis longicornis]